MYGTTAQMTTDGDLFVNNLQTIPLTTDYNKVAQDLWVLLRTVKNTYPLNPDFGIDYLSIIENGYVDSNIQNIIRSEIIKHPAVKDVTDITHTRTTNRGLNISIKVTLQNNETLSVNGGIQ